MVEVRGGESAAELPEELAAKLAHIEAVSKNARGTWLSLIAVLLFSAIAVAGVRDQDYFVYGSALVLPVINVSVPIKSFFYAGPLIVLGLYTYLHLYLIKLWRALATIDAQPAKGVWLDDLVFPWLISDAAIFLKPGAPKRPFRWLTQLASISFLWAAAPLVLVLFWVRSFPPHDGWLTAWTGIMAALSLLVGSMSLLVWRQILRTRWDNPDSAFQIEQTKPLVLIWAIVAGALLIEGWAKSTGGVQTENVLIGGLGHIYPTKLYRAEIVERPSGWISYQEALEEFKTKYSGVRRKDLNKPEHSDADWIDTAELAFLFQRNSLLSKLRANDFPDSDLSSSNLRGAFLPGIDLARSDLRSTDFTVATLEGAILKGANLSRASLNGTDLNDAILFGADLREASLLNARLINAYLDEADLSKANLRGANLRNAQLINADLRSANLRRARLVKADLRDADLREANLSSANLIGADLSTTDSLTQGQINSAYGDGSTKLPELLDRPKHWPDEVLSSSEITQRWFAWVNGEGK